MKATWLDAVTRGHLQFFQYIGYHNVDLDVDTDDDRRQRNEKRWMIWTMLLFFVFSIVATNTFTSNDQYLYTGDMFGHFNDALKVSSAQLALSISYFESIFRRTDVRRFWQEYRQLHAKSSTLNETNNCWWQKWQNLLVQHSRFLCLFYGMTLAELVVQLLFFVLYERMSRHLVLFWTMFTPYIILVRFRNLQCILYMECMRRELQQLARELALLADYTHFSKCLKRKRDGFGNAGAFPGFEEFVRRKLVQLQRSYQRIYEMYACYQRGFGWSIVGVLLMQYVRVLVDTYFIYYSLFRGWSALEDILLIPALLEIPMFLLTSKNCMKAVKYITLQLHNIKHNVDNEQLSLQIQNFSLQLLHQKIRIDAVGITVMDGYMLSNAIGSITTYMIFFIQFMPKFQNL